jgi:iron(III) transport system substrate-binding protein
MDKPDSILAYTNPCWKGRAVIANPLFGTTTAHVAALFLAWGEERARKFMNDLKENAIKISTRNGESADLVAKGEVDFGVVDSDDAVNRMRQGKPVDMVCPDEATGQLGCLILPNAAMLLKDAPHPREAKSLIDYLLSRESERKLAFADCAQIPLHPGVETPNDVPKIKKLKAMPTNYAAIARKLQDIQPYLKAWVGY